MRRLAVRALLTIVVAVGLIVPVTASSAHASGWTNLYLQPRLSLFYSSARVCKTYEVGGYGPVWKYRFEMYRINPYQPQSRMTARILRDNSYWLYPGVTNNQWWYGVGGSLYIYGSALHNDQVQFAASDDYYYNSFTVGAAGIYHSYDIADC